MKRFKSFLGAAAVLMLLSPLPTITPAWSDIVRATPRAHCGAGDHPETGLQGRVSAEDVSSGRAAEGFTCNTALVSHFGNVDGTELGGAGGWRVYRYVDPHG